MKELKIYERDLTGGLCGYPAEIPGMPSAEEIRKELIRRNGAVRKVEKELGVKVDRIVVRMPSQIENKIVKDLLESEGIKAMPVFVLNKKIMHYGNFPGGDKLVKMIREMGNNI
ncbi:MAG: arsenic metallochaperone ArsD family protein [Candidatus Helarchaeota archaeon]